MYKVVKVDPYKFGAGVRVEFGLKDMFYNFYPRHEVVIPDDLYDDPNDPWDGYTKKTIVRIRLKHCDAICKSISKQSESMLTRVDIYVANKKISSRDEAVNYVMTHQPQHSYVGVGQGSLWRWDFPVNLTKYDGDVTIIVSVGVKCYVSEPFNEYSILVAVAEPKFTPPLVGFTVVHVTNKLIRKGGERHESKASKKSKKSAGSSSVVVKSLIEENTRREVVPKPKPPERVVKPKPVVLKEPEIEVKPEPVIKATFEPRRRIDPKKVLLGLIGAGILYKLIRRKR